MKRKFIFIWNESYMIVFNLALIYILYLNVNLILINICYYEKRNKGTITDDFENTDFNQS